MEKFRYREDGPTVTQVVDGLPPVEFDGVTVTKEDAGGVASPVWKGVAPLDGFDFVSEWLYINQWREREILCIIIYVYTYEHIDAIASNILVLPHRYAYARNILVLPNIYQTEALSVKTISFKNPVYYFSIQMLSLKFSQPS